MVFLLVDSLMIDTIKIGVIGEFGRSDTTASVDSYRAVEYAVERLNNAGGTYELYRFDILTYSDQNRLIEELESVGIDIILGPTTTGQYRKVKDILKQVDIPVFLLAVSDNEVSHIDDNIFRLTDTVETQVAKITTCINRYFETNRLEIFYSSHNKVYSKELADSIMNNLSAFDEVIATEVGHLEDSEVVDMLLNTKAADGYIVIAGPSQAGIICQLLGQTHPTTPILLPAWAKSENTLDFTRHLENDIYILSNPPTVRVDNYRDVEEELLKYRNVSMTSFAYFGYETMYLVDELIKQSGHSDLKAIKKAVVDLDVYKGQFNDFTLNDFGDGGRGYSLMKIIDGEYVLVD